MFLSLGLLLVLGMVVAAKFVSFVLPVSARGGGLEGGKYFEEILVQAGDASSKIAVVPVEGLISRQFSATGRDMVDVIEDQLKLAAKDQAVKAVILKVDSPGGEVMASDDIARALADFQAAHKKPVIASLQGLAASGGYYVSAPCQWIVANELTITGSIGVILSSFNYRGLMDKVGLQPMVFKSGRFKDMLRGSKKAEEIDPEEQRMIQEMVMETYQKFKSVVQTGREAAAVKNGVKGRKLAADWEQYADGRILTGKAARDLGFVDQLGNFQTAVEAAREIAGVTGKPRLIRYQEPFSLARVFGFGADARAGVRGQFTERIRGTAKAGYEHRYYHGRDDTLDSPVVEISVDAQLSERTLLTGSYSRRQYESIQTVNTVYTTDALAFIWQQQIGGDGRLRSQVRASYITSDFDRSNAAPSRTDQVMLAGLTLSYDIKVWMRVFGSYTFEHLNSDEPTVVDYNVNRLTLGLQIGY